MLLFLGISISNALFVIELIRERYDAKTVIRNSVPSIFSWSEVYLNPYQGCFHDCTYCDGKSEHYHMHEDFGTRIRIKQNSPQLLERFFRKQGLRPVNREEKTLLHHLGVNEIQQEKTIAKFILFIGGGVCDVYQPIEEEEQLTRKLVELAYEYNVPVHILTKNHLVLRDLDLFKTINESSYASINFTITLNDDKIQKIIEPNASTSAERFSAIKSIRKEGIHSGVYFYPVLPFLGDSDNNYLEIFSNAKKVGAEFVYCWGLTLKPGRSKNEFLKTVRTQFPSYLPKYAKLYGNNNKYGILDYKQIKPLKVTLPEVKGFQYNYEFKIPYTAKRYIPPGRIQSNLALSEILMRAHHLKVNVLKEKSKEGGKLYKAALILEKCPEDVLRMNKNHYKMLFIPHEAEEYIIDYFVSGKNTKLKELEREVYQRIMS